MSVTAAGMSVFSAHTFFYGFHKIALKIDCAVTLVCAGATIMTLYAPIYMYMVGMGEKKQPLSKYQFGKTDLFWDF